MSSILPMTVDENNSSSQNNLEIVDPEDIYVTTKANVVKTD